MAIDFKALKQRSQALQKDGKKAFQTYQNVFKPNNYEDPTFWTLKRGANGNGSATIRFLPNPQGDTTLNFVRYYDHFFKVPETGKYYVENSLTTFNITDPIGEYIRQLWQRSKFDPEAEKLARAFKRKTNFVSNILVIDDPEQPENNGKVFKYKYGIKIFDKIKEAIAPEFANQQPVDVFDPWMGANFHLRMKKDGMFYSYDSSSFDLPSAIGDDDYIIEVLQQCHDISYIADIDGIYQGKPFYKSVEELQQSLENAFNGNPLEVDEEEVIEVKETKRIISPPKQEYKQTTEIDEDLPFEIDGDEEESEEEDDKDAFLKFLDQ